MQYRDILKLPLPRKHVTGLTSIRSAGARPSAVRTLVVKPIASGERCRCIETSDLQTSAIRRLAHLHKCAGGVLWLRQDTTFAAVAPCRMPLPTACTEPVESAFSRKLAEDCICELGATSAHASVLPAWTRRVPELGVAVPLLVGRELIGFIGLQHSLAIPRLDRDHRMLLGTTARSAAAKMAGAGSYLPVAAAAMRMA